MLLVSRNGARPPPRTTTVGTNDAQKQQKQNTKKNNAIPDGDRYNDMNDATSGEDVLSH